MIVKRKSRVHFMNNNGNLPPTLHSALNLDGSPDSVKEFYSTWASRYEEDTTRWNYAAPANALALLQGVSGSGGHTMDPADPGIRIMDAGCGTGLLARVLGEAGYTNIDGFDLSPEMVDIARQTGLYRHLEGNVDLNAPVKREWVHQYDCTVSVGVFTPGHVPPRALSQLARMTRPGGLVIVSTRVEYYQSENFQQVSDDLESRGTLTLIKTLKNASYTTDEKAHYWVYAARPA